MKRLIFIIGIVATLFSTQQTSAQVPTIDSIHRQVNKWVTSSATQAFVELRLNRILHGILFRIDSADGGGGGSFVDTLYQINDSTIRYKRNGVNYNFSLKGVYDSRRKVDTIYRLNDSTLRYTLNGIPHDILVRGNSSGGGGGGTETIDAFSLKRTTKLFSRVPVFKTVAEARTIGVADLDTSFVYKIKVGGIVREFYYDDDDATSADDSVMVIRTTVDNKCLKAVDVGYISPRWWGAVADYNGSTGTNSGPAFNKMFRWMELHGNNKVNLEGGRYFTSTQIVLPYTLPTVSNQPTPYMVIEGGGAHITTNAAINIFYRMPSTDADVSIMNNNYKLTIKNLFINGDRSTAGQTGVRVACGYGWVFENMHFYGLDTAFVGSFLTKSIIRNSFFTVNNKVDVVLQSLSGLVGTQTVPGSASNDNTIENVRNFMFSGSHAAYVLRGTDNTVINHYVIEGAQPRYGIYADYQNSSVVNALFLNDGWFEGNSSSPSVNFRIMGSGLTRITNIQRSYADTLFDFSGSQSQAQFEIDGLTYGGNLAAKPFNVSTTDASFSGKSITFKNIDASTAALLVDPTKWVGGSLPANMSIDYWQGANLGRTIKTTSNLYILSRVGIADAFNRYMYIDQNLVFVTDNSGSIGGSYTVAANRPRAVHVGQTGVYVDNLGRYYFGQAGSVTPDVSIGRVSSGWLGIYDNSTNFKNLKVDSGLFNSRSGYTSSFSLASMGNNDFITKQQLTDALAEATPNLFFGDEILGSGTVGDKYHIDTTVYIATKTDIANAVGVGLTAVTHDITLTGAGTPASPLKVDTSMISTLSRLYFVADSIGDLIGTPLNDVGYVVDGVGYTVSGSGTSSDPYTFTITGSPTSNPFKAISIESYGGIADATVPGSGSSPNGTNNTPFLNSAIAAAADGQWIVVPSGNWKFSTPVDTITGGTSSQNKEVNILVIGNIFLDGNDLFRIKNQAGSNEQHKIVFQGDVFGRVNQPAHNNTTFTAGTGPVFSSYNNVVVKLINVNQSYIEFNKVYNTKAPIEIIGGGGYLSAGSQENTVVGRYFIANTYGIWLQSLDGSSYVDKNVFTGPSGGTLRIGGHIPLYIDGYSGLVGGEQYNGAFRSNEFHFLIELADSLPVVNGDVTEPLFDITIENGGNSSTGTGILAPNSYWQLRSVSPNFVRSPKFTGRGFYDPKTFGTGGVASMGVNGSIDVPLWYNASTFYGKRADIDGTGNILIKTPGSTSQSTRNLAPAFVKFINEETAPSHVTITAATYTVGNGVTHVFYSNTAGTMTLPSPSAWPAREITVFNTNSNPLTIGGTLGAGTAAVILGNKSSTYYSTGSEWYAKGDGVGTAGALGVCHRVTDANVTVNSNDFSVIVYNQSATRTVTMPLASSYPGRVLAIVQQDGNGNTLQLKDSGGTNVLWRGRDGSTSAVLLNNNSVTLHSDGTEWHALSEQ